MDWEALKSGWPTDRVSALLASRARRHKYRRTSYAEWLWMLACRPFSQLVFAYRAPAEISRLAARATAIETSFSPRPPPVLPPLQVDPLGLSLLRFDSSPAAQSEKRGVPGHITARLEAMAGGHLPLALSEQLHSAKGLLEPSPRKEYEPAVPDTTLQQGQRRQAELKAQLDKQAVEMAGLMGLLSPEQNQPADSNFSGVTVPTAPVWPPPRRSMPTDPGRGVGERRANLEKMLQQQADEIERLRALQRGQGLF
eukprot:TRINITY_DN44931_c0_g1_i1.p1 TRINITY_DN44931_c0_g1~~TRINITY_DN44931_c0_g1_i1.p1  ORF type:complete len:254 (+),score=47.16 TRINITY_DN44931_c0_g1_i1:278-1039(+)